MENHIRFAPRWCTVAYLVLVRATDYHPEASTDALNALWVDVNKTSKLAFDHEDILKLALARLQGKIRYTPIGFNLLPTEFTLADLRTLYESILQRPLDPSNFRKRALATNVLVEVGTGTTQGPGRPARLYCFNETAYKKAEKEGFNFEI